MCSVPAVLAVPGGDGWMLGLYFEKPADSLSSVKQIAS